MKLLEINQSSNFLNLIGLIDREIFDSFEAIVEILCDDVIRGYDKVTVNILDIDDNPPLFTQTHYYALVKEGQPKGTKILSTYVYDADISHNSLVTFILEQHWTQHDEFSIDSNDGTVRTNIPLSYNTQSRYDLIVKAFSDTSSLVFDKTKLTIFVVNINDQNPTLPESGYSFTLSEYTPRFTIYPPGYLLQSVQATDSDGNTDEISYTLEPSILKNNEQSDKRRVPEFISIGFTTGDLIITRKLNQQDVGHWQFNIVASDGRNQGKSVVTIQVIDINNQLPEMSDEPKTVRLSNFNSSLINSNEFFRTGQQVIETIHAYDLDTDSKHRKVKFIPNYDWIGLSKLFSVTESRDNYAKLVTVIPINHLKDNVYFLPIKLTDGVFSTISLVTIIKETLNSNRPPTFLNVINQKLKPIKLMNFSDISIGQLITNFKCYEQDIGQILTYQMTISSQCIGMFYINPETGSMYLINKTTSATNSLTCYSNISCHDNGTPVKYDIIDALFQIENIQKLEPENFIENVAINLNKLNDMNLPKIIYTFNKPQLKLTLVSVESQLSYQQIRPSDKPYFTIDSHNKLILNSIDFTIENKWKLLIKSQNSIANPSYIIVNVSWHLSAQNTECPIKIPLSGVVSENTPFRSFILQLPTFPEHKIWSVDRNHHTFQLKCISSNCTLMTRIQLNYEKQKKYTLKTSLYTMQPSSRDHCQVTVQINILDVDEFQPQFETNNKIIVIKWKGQTPNKQLPDSNDVLYRVKATDRDGGYFGLILYQIINGNKDGYFVIDGYNGEIKLAQKFDRISKLVKRHKRDVDASNTENSKYPIKRKTFVLDVAANSGRLRSIIKLKFNIPVPIVPENNSRLYSFTRVHFGLVIGLPLLFIVGLIAILVVVLTKRSRSANSQKPSQTLQTTQPSHTCTKKCAPDNCQLSLQLLINGGLLTPNNLYVNKQSSSLQHSLHSMLPPPPVTQYYGQLPAPYSMTFQHGNVAGFNEQGNLNNRLQQQQLPDVALLTKNSRSIPNSDTQTFHLESTSEEDIMPQSSSSKFIINSMNSSQPDQLMQYNTNHPYYQTQPNQHHQIAIKQKSQSNQTTNLLLSSSMSSPSTSLNDAMIDDNSDEVDRQEDEIVPPKEFYDPDNSIMERYKEASTNFNSRSIRPYMETSQLSASGPSGPFYEDCNQKYNRSNPKLSHHHPQSSISSNHYQHQLTHHIPNSVSNYSHQPLLPQQDSSTSLTSSSAYSAISSQFFHGYNIQQHLSLHGNNISRLREGPIDYTRINTATTTTNTSTNNNTSMHGGVSTGNRTMGRLLPMPAGFDRQIQNNYRELSGSLVEMMPLNQPEHMIMDSEQPKILSIHLSKSSSTNLATNPDKMLLSSHSYYSPFTDTANNQPQPNIVLPPPPPIPMLPDLHSYHHDSDC